MIDAAVPVGPGGDVKVLAVQVEVSSRDGLRDMADQLRAKLGTSVVALGASFEGQQAFVVGASGTVAWAGKPYRPAYDLALAAAAEARGGRPVEPGKVLVIGDAVRTDLAGARLMGFDSLFIAGGIHRDETMRGGEVDPAGLAKVLDGLPVRPIAAMGALA